MALHTQRGFSAAVGGHDVQISLLNGFEAQSSRGRLEIPAVGARLIAYLALQQRPVRRCALAGTLWPDTTQEKAQASLRSTLWRVRKVEDRIVRCTHECVELDDAVEVDTHCVTSNGHELGDEEHGGIDARQLILNLSGELLPDWYDDWVIFERERFRLMALSALEHISSALTDQRRFAEAVEYALAAVRLEPLRESAHRALIRAHIAEGNVGEGLRQYRLYEEIVQTELGIGPSTQMSDLLTRAGLCADLLATHAVA